VAVRATDNLARTERSEHPKLPLDAACSRPWRRAHQSGTAARDRTERLAGQRRKFACSYQFCWL